MRLTIVVTALALVLAVPVAHAADPPSVKPDRAAINRLLDQFIPDVVAKKDLRRGWDLSAGYTHVVSFKEWMKGDTSVQDFPAKGRRFHGWLLNYSYPGDVGFDILLQPTSPTRGAASFRGEAQKIGGRWKITTWYEVAEYAPPGQLQHVQGPAEAGLGVRFVGDKAKHRGGRSKRTTWIGAIALLALVAIALTVARRLSRPNSAERRG